MIGVWRWRYGKFVLKFRIVRGGWLYIGKWRTRLVISRLRKYLTAAKGFFMFRFKGFTFYLSYRNTWLYQFGKKCKRTLRGNKNLCGYSKIGKGEWIFVVYV